MSEIDLDHLRRWVGTRRVDDDVITERHARLMAATVDYPAADSIRDGEALPALWHWLYFLEGAPARELGRDGHPARGGFLPPVPLANRMWAGGRVRFVAPVRVGSTVRRTSTVLRVDHKRGRSGDLVFVTVLHELHGAAGEALLREEHDIVYRNPPPPIAAADNDPLPAASSKLPAANAAVPSAAASSVAPSSVAPSGSAAAPRVFVPTSTALFRYSALTFNGHRIHYDADYCRDVEGYPNLVVHGPLLATLLANLAEAQAGERLASFDYRALAPAFLGEAIALGATVDARRIELAATVGGTRVCMRAQASPG